MNNSENTSYCSGMVGEIVDFAKNKVAESAKRMVTVVIRDSEEWIMKKYKEMKSRQAAKPKYEDLQRYIEQHDEMVQIGMDKEEIAIIWAMKKLDYSSEQMQEVLDLASKAYLPQGEK